MSKSELVWKRYISPLSIILILLLGYSNCSQQMIEQPMGDAASVDSMNGDMDSNNIDGFSYDQDDAGYLMTTSQQYVQCKFLSVDNIRSVLSDQLGLSEGDVAQYDEQGHWRKNYVDTYASGLGEGDMSDMLSQVRDDHECTALKFKLAMEVFIEGCSEAMSRDGGVERLFPNGVQDVSHIYLMFLGREPSSIEVDLLNDLADSVSAQTAEAAVCGALLTSVEVLDRS